jgi:hypothetical protein
VGLTKIANLKTLPISLSNQRYIHISQCCSLLKVSHIFNIRDLTIYSSESLLYIGDLRNIRNMFIYFCPKLRIIKNLQNIGMLTICECSKLENIDNLGTIQHRLTINNCENLKEQYDQGKYDEIKNQIPFFTVAEFF